MKPILNKEMVLEFVREQNAKNKEFEKTDSIQDLARGLGRSEILSALLELLINTI